ncbi:unnamed protein product [Euphydryas editha]|uniref:C2H2-type domain-containing protein n=1 Tax=Euphydryas editha TaxID=104508 RepID=A0AAU9T9S8_EUPED|nr:unnamed protein product [Euphydryas editha]
MNTQNLSMSSDVIDDITKESNENTELPEIYINYNFLTKQYENCENIEEKLIFKKEYLINGLSFYEEPFKDRNVLQEFEITKDKEKLEIKILDGYSNANDTSSDQYLEISIQETPYGLIINSMLVPENNWHSIISEQCGVRCMVCDMTVAKSEDHIKLKTHVDNLNKYKPLKEFNFNITRKIGDNYQCVICNVIFNVSNIEEHLESKEHVEQILYSTNRAFDILDFELQNYKNIDHSDNRISNDRDVNESVISFNDKNINDNNISSVDSKNDDRSDICPNKKSYALILKESAKLDVSKDREVKLEDDSWHMIVTPGNKEFYCMVCVSFDDLSNKTKHYTDKEHLKKLNECTIVEKYKQYFVRQRTNDYYCGVCDFSSSELFMTQHINEIRHMENVTTIPFLINFGLNLIRMVKQVAHCAICNVVFVITLTYEHTLDPTHIRLLKAAIVQSPNHMNVPIQPSQMNQLAIESTSTNQTKIDVNESSKKETKIDVNESSGNLKKVESYNFECIYLKLKNTYVKVTYKSYNGLISIGDGSHYCFLCSLRMFGSLKEHMEDEKHLIHLKNCHFIDKYDKHLLRQNSFAYHCCSCNIMFTKRELSAHLTWQVIQSKSDKKTRKNEFKSGIKQINIKTIQESAISNVESKITIIAKIIKKNDGNVEIKKCNKFVVFNGKALKILWDSWHGFSKNKNGFYCTLCQRDLKVYDVNTHISEEKHISVLENSFEKKFLPSIIRKIKDNKLQCLICNVKVLDNLVVDHINSKKHKNNLTINHIDIENLCGKDILYV